MTKETEKAINESRNYFNRMWNDGFITGEMTKYHNLVEKIFETLGITPDYV